MKVDCHYGFPLWMKIIFWVLFIYFYWQGSYPHVLFDPYTEWHFGNVNYPIIIPNFLMYALGVVMYGFVTWASAISLMPSMRFMIDSESIYIPNLFTRKTKVVELSSLVKKQIFGGNLHLTDKHGKEHVLKWTAFDKNDFQKVVKEIVS